jgi:mono/diheme cytochrome c family protein
MMKFIVGVLVGCALIVAFGSYLLLGRGIQVRTPGRLEIRIMTAAKHRLLVDGKNVKNLLPATAENIAEGRRNFLHYCYACHGLDGQATGVPFADAMAPPVPSLTSPDVQAYSDGQLYWVIKNGLWPSGMPAAKGILNDEEIWSIVEYVRHLPPVGSLGEPPAYNSEGCAESTKQTRRPTEDE